jgi:ABC-type multidrug transport system permease subunit
LRLRALGAAIVKDLRLLARDRAGLIFLTLAPMVVMTVAGFSLASLYGADPRGTAAYLFPVADEDGGRIGRALVARLAGEGSLRVQSVASSEEARALVRRQRAGAALVVPAGTSDALAAGRPATLRIYTDPVKYLEVARATAIVQELRHGLEAAARERAQRRLARLQHRASAARADLVRATHRLAVVLDALPARLAAGRRDAEARLRTARGAALRALHARLEAQRTEVRARLSATLAPLRAFLEDLGRARAEFEAWTAAVRRKAGRLADRVPPPPAPPTVPAALAELARLDPDALLARLLPPDRPVELPSPPAIALPPPPALSVAALALPPRVRAVHLPGVLAIAEESVTGAPQRLNTFDQNVPGFSVTFLLLGMLLGVSLGLLDERDWGTLERTQTTPTPLAIVLLAKLFARFGIGVLQMGVLFAFGRLAFGVSLGPQPWALALPTIGIVFAGTAFGLVVAAAIDSREAVLPVGSIVIVTMAAVGGCWWPIDLEPPWMRSAALALPTTWAMAAYNDLMIRRQTVAAALAPTAILLAHGVLYTACGLLLFRRRMGRRP